jgi:hypothetical protein
MDMEPDQYVRACGLLFVNEFKKAAQLFPEPGAPAVDEIHIADASSNFFDRRTGELIVECGYWSCTRNPRVCDLYCPPPGWNCAWEQP